MKDGCYRKIYPFEKSVFVAKFTAGTVPFDERKSGSIPLGRKLEGRVFVGEIRGNNFKLTTSPDMWDAIRHPWAGIGKVPVWRNPSCIYGSIQESEGYTIVEYTIGVMKTSRFISKQGIVIGCVGVWVCIMSAYMEGFHLGVLLGVVIMMLHILSSFLALQPHQSENDVLIKFMEDLEK